MDTRTHTRTHTQAELTRTCDILTLWWVDSSCELLRQNPPLTRHHRCYFEPLALMMCGTMSQRCNTRMNFWQQVQEYTPTYTNRQALWQTLQLSADNVISSSHHTHTHTHSCCTLKFSDYRVPLTRYSLLSTQIKPAVRIMVTCARPMKLERCSKALQ